MTQYGAQQLCRWLTLRTGHTYRLQFKNNLTDPAWTDALPDVTANSATASASDNVGLIANRFYRVMLVQ